MLDFIKNKIKRKIAKLSFSEYPSTKHTFHLIEDGSVDFYVWNNPLEGAKIISQEQVDFYRKFNLAEKLVIDIGAHIGDTAVPLALATGKHGTTLAFEPNPYIFKVLEKNAAANSMKTNIVALPYAITDEDGEFYYNSSEASHNNGGVSQEEQNYHGKYQLKQKVSGINLLKYLEKNYVDNIKDLAFVKIDTEGLDIIILKSIKDLLHKHKPVVIAECFKKFSASERAEMLEIFHSLEYKVYHLSKFDANAELSLISEAKDMLNWSHFDVIAVANESSEEIEAKFKAK